VEVIMHLPVPLFLSTVAARTALVLFALVFGIRLFGKRDVGDMNLVDALMVLLVGNAVQNALTYGSGMLGVGLVSAGTLLVLDRLLGVLFVQRPWLERKLLGEPHVIYADGQMDRRLMEREGVEDDELLEAARARGLADLERVHLAVLEPDGTISIVPKEDDHGEEG
jgi:uncharacterized membrane protein YcaP (DUF421 family)